MNIKSLLRDSEDTVDFPSVGDEVTIDTNWIGVNPKLKKGKVIGFGSSMASHGNSSEKLVRVEFEDGSKGSYNIYAIQELTPDSKKQVIKDAEAGDFSIVRVGGSVGEVKTGRIGGTMVKVIESDLSEDVAKQKAKDLNSGLSKGDKSYYGIKYKAVKTSTIRS